MSDWLVDDNYRKLQFHRANPLGGISRERHYSTTFLTKFGDTFFALRGQKLSPMNSRGKNDPFNFTPLWQPIRGDKFGFLDYGFLMIPAALKVISHALIWESLNLLRSDSKSISTLLKVLFGAFLLIPSLAIGIALTVASWLLDQVKNILALTITLAVSLPVLLPLHAWTVYQNNKEFYITHYNDELDNSSDCGESPGGSPLTARANGKKR